MKFLISDSLAIGISTAVITIFSLLFYFDITKKVESSDIEEVGIITFKRNTAQRKYSSQVVWEDIEENVSVYNNDTIRTADISEAVVQLKDGTQIALIENSMILLALTKTHIDIEFFTGSIITNRASVKRSKIKTLNIKSKKTTVSIGKSNIKLDKPEGKDISLSVRRGHAMIGNPSMKSSDVKLIKQDQQVVVSKDSNNIEIYTPDFKLNLPNPNSYFITSSKTEKINFSWEDIIDKHNNYFELSENRSFKNILKKERVFKNFKSIELPEGTYFWRLSSEEKSTGKTQFSDCRRLTIIIDYPAQLIFPENEAIISYRKKEPLINFKWKKSEIAKGYKIIISKDPSMKNIFKTVNITNNNFATDSLTRGIYYWRIEKRFDPSVLSHVDLSNIYKLIISIKKGITPPELIDPSNNIALSKTLLKNRNITFSWKANPQINETMFYIAKDKNFNNIIYSSSSRVNFLQFNKDLQKGKYYWRVIGFTGDGEETKPSQWRFFNVIQTKDIEITLPANNEIFTPAVNDEEALIKFSWRKSNVKGIYNLQISRDKNFLQIYKESRGKRVSGTISDIKPGVYYWRVSLIDRNGFLITRSNPQTIVVKDKLVKPSVISPENGLVINMKNRENLAFSWKEIDGANLYKIGLYHIRKRRKYSVVEKETKKNSYIIKEMKNLAEGKFFWTLQAFEIDDKNQKEIRKSPIIKTFFKITLGGSIKKLEIKTLKIQNIK